jgi:hypothetical protein
MLYLTQDGGKNWAQFVEDPEAEKATSGTRYQRTLELPGEGVFGLYLVVRNPAGVGKAAPRPGDAPEMVIEVDTTTPSATLFKPGPDPARRDALLLTWSAEDRNLTARPVALEWATESEGPWQEIASDLPNTGKYSWVVPQGTPVRVYLRLRVRDTAGNVGLAVTSQPQLVDLSEPEGALVGVRPSIKRAGQ